MSVNLTKSEEFIEKKSSELYCNFPHINQNYIENIIWYKDDEPIGNIINITYSNDYKTLIFVYLNRTIHNGTYFCALNTNYTTKQEFKSQKDNVTILGMMNMGNILFIS